MIKVVPFIYNDDIDDLFSNTYVVYDDKNQAIVIDPSHKNTSISDYIKKNNLNLVGVLLTHAHFDHMRGVDILVNEFKCPFYLFYLDEEMLTNPFLNGSTLLSEKDMIVLSKPTLLKENEVLKLLDEDMNVLYTPFHTLGSVCFYFKESKLLFSGDTLFKSGIGRDDLPNNDRKNRKKTLDKLLKLDDDVKVYPGHGSLTSMKEEKPNFIYY